MTGEGDGSAITLFISAGFACLQGEYCPTNTGQRTQLNEQPFATKRPVISPRTVVAYHGCSMATAETILTGDRFLPSTNTYDWLGAGIYFWEYAPYRALEWARLKCAKSGGEPAVLGATIRLRRCLNLLDTQHSAELATVFRILEARYQSKRMPVNRELARYLDCKVIDSYCDLVAEENQYGIQTVRGCFPEGLPIYTDSSILSLTHVQIAVRDVLCIYGAHLVHFA